MKKKKLLVFTTSFAPRKSGVGEYVLHVFSRLVKKGHDVTLICYDTEDTKVYYEEIQGIKVHRIKCHSLFKKTYFIPQIIDTIKVLRKIKNQKFDVCFTNTRFLNATVVGGIYSKFKSIPWVHIEYGATLVKSNNPVIWLGSRFFDFTLGISVFNLCDKIITISEFSKSFVRSFTNHPIEVIYITIDESNISVKPNKKVYDIVYIGRLIYAKGVQDLIVAFSNLVKKFPKQNLYIVGKGAHKEELERLAQNLNISSKVKFMGEKNKKEVYDILSKTKIFVHPSYTEGLPVSVIEAGVFSLPVIATPAGGTREIIIDKKTGISVKEHSPDEIEKALKTLIENDSIGKKYSENLRNLTKTRFNLNKIVDQWESLIKNTKN